MSCHGCRCPAHQALLFKYFKTRHALLSLPPLRLRLCRQLKLVRLLVKEIPLLRLLWDHVHPQNPPRLGLKRRQGALRRWGSCLRLAMPLHPRHTLA